MAILTVPSINRVVIMPSASAIDPAILRALSLPPDVSARIKPHGGSGFSSTARLTITRADSSGSSKDDDSDIREWSYFVKTSTSPGAEIMFQGEHASLNAIHRVVPSLCPRSIAWGPVDQGHGQFLITEFLDLNPRTNANANARARASSNPNSSRQHQRQRQRQREPLTLAQKLAKLHSTPAPIPDGFDDGVPQFGFPVTTCCGDTPQRNAFTPSWAEFFGQHRLIMILEENERNNGRDVQLRSLVERVVEQVVPRLLGDGHLGGPARGIVPVVVHGDLWAGNKGKARFVGRPRSRSSNNKEEDDDDEEEEEEEENNGQADVEDVIFDPSAFYAHNEYEFGIMRMFGGFNVPSFWKQYHEIVPKTEPVEEFEDRCALYESYHHLNHSSIFGGGGYRASGMAILKQLLRKYGDKQ